MAVPVDTIRDYDPSIGRYIQGDPIGILREYSDPIISALVAFGMIYETEFADEELNHLYGYVGQKPILWFDPWGLAEHTKNKRPSSKGKHEKGNARRGADAGGEKGDERRRKGGKRPKKHKGPWPMKTPLDFMPNPCMLNPGLAGCPKACQYNPTLPGCIRKPVEC